MIFENATFTSCGEHGTAVCKIPAAEDTATQPVENHRLIRLSQDFAKFLKFNIFKHFTAVLGYPLKVPSTPTYTVLIRVGLVNRH